MSEEIEYTDIREKDGYKYHAFVENDACGDSAWFTFQDEEDVRQRFYYPYLSKYMHVLDIGAGYGSYTLPALQKGCEVTIITPQVPNKEHIKLKMNIELNKYKDWKIIDRAVYSDYGWINPNTKHFAKYGHLKEQKTEKEYVRCAPIDDLVQDTKVDFIKLDVEGAELEAIKGAERTIKTNKPIMLVENHLFHDPEMDKKIIALILKWGLGYMAAVVPYNQVSHTLFTIQNQKDT